MPTLAHGPCCVVVILTLLGLPGLGAQAPEEAAQAAAMLELAPEIRETVQQIRKLEFKEEVPMELLTREKFKEFLLDKLHTEIPVEEQQASELAYKALGLIPEDYDLVQGFVALVEAGVMGLYDEETGKLFVLADAPASGYTRLILAHELLHALEDQHFDLGSRMEALEDHGDDDASFALKGFIEGTASLLMSEYIEVAGIDPMDLQTGMMEKLAELNDMPSIPLILMRDMNLPYTRGPGFISYIAGEDGNWDKVNALFDDPPVSGEQILHPSRYGKDYPVAIEFPPITEVLEEGWEEVWTGRLGEMGVAALVDTHDGRTENFLQAQTGKGYNEVSRGWDGDRYGVYRHPEREARGLAWITVWDTTADAREFYEHYATTGFAARLPDAVDVEGGVEERRRVVETAVGMGHVEVQDLVVLVVEGFTAEETQLIVDLLSQCRITRDERDQVEDDTAAVDDPLVRRLPELNLLLKVPADDWVVKDASAMLMGMGQSRTVQDPEGGTEVSITMIPGGGAMPLETMWPMLLNQVRMQARGSEVAEEDEARVGGITGKGATMASEQGRVRLVVLARGSDLYMFRSTLPVGADEGASEQLQGVLDSIEFTED